jgi:hypothetical protein
VYPAHHAGCASAGILRMRTARVGLSQTAGQWISRFPCRWLVKYVYPDCGFWMLKRNVADGKIRAPVEGRDLYEGRSQARGAARQAKIVPDPCSRFGAR